MKILIREGSAAKNFDALIPLLDTHYENMMFCCDDKHPDELLLHHINHHVKKALAYGCDLYKVLQCACINPVKHYQLEIGLLQVGDPADFILINNLKDWDILATYIDGEVVYQKDLPVSMTSTSTIINQFHCTEKKPEDFYVPEIIQPIIQVLDGQLITKSIEQDSIPSIDLGKDILQISVINRYHDAPIASAYINGVGLKKGAIASTVAHDSHNIIVVGTDHEAMALAANEIIHCKGGICATDGNHSVSLPLPIAGIMSDQDIYTVAEQYKSCDQFAKELGSTLQAPFMSLSFMALLVIPELKLSDKGLWDGKEWKFLTNF
jgi:adenine deaminase